MNHFYERIYSIKRKLRCPKLVGCTPLYPINGELLISVPQQRVCEAADKLTHESYNRLDKWMTWDGVEVKDGKSNEPVLVSKHTAAKANHSILGMFSEQRKHQVQPSKSQKPPEHITQSKAPVSPPIHHAYRRLSVLMNDGTSTIMPCGEKNATFTAMVLDVLERAHHEGNASKTQTEAT